MRQSLVHLTYLFTAKKTFLAHFHIAGRDCADKPSGEATKNHQSQTAVQGRSHSDVKMSTSTPDLVVAGENFFDLFGGELMSFDMRDIFIVPLKPGNNQISQ